MYDDLILRKVQGEPLPKDSVLAKMVVSHTLEECERSKKDYDEISYIDVSGSYIKVVWKGESAGTS